ncbi:MAG: GTP-binding protein [Nostocaceae cyanobacterium]|nr:GTP-binding protein [Nostocaceae cyanobacterium]
MTIPQINVVAGPAGSGKTTWICSDMTNNVSTENILYFSPGTVNVPIDQTRIAAEYPHVKVLDDGQEIEFLNQLSTASVVYIELGFYLELSAINQILDDLPYRAIAVLPPHLENSEWHAWTQEIIPGIDAKIELAQTRLWRAPATGQVLDEDSLQEFWYELTHGAYGSVARAKGIFDVADGRAIGGDFVVGVAESEFTELNLPRHLEGRPQRFSGIEVWGQNLDDVSLRQTLVDCCLSDAAILQYQAQVKEMLAAGVTA